MIKDIDCFILCGGKGKRLKKITGKVPKPMASIGKRPFLDIVICHLRRLGFKRFILGVGYGAEFIKKYYSKNKIPGVKIIFSKEARLLGTGGALKKAQKFIKSKDFLVINGDSFSDFNPREFIRSYRQKNASALILLRKIKNSKDYGLVSVNPRSEIVSYNEKISKGRGGFINSGVYLFSRKIFSMMPAKPVFSLEYDFFPSIVGKGLYGHKGSGFFIDIGTPDRYLKAKEYFLKNKGY